MKAGYSKKRKSSKLSSSQSTPKRAFLPSDLLPSSTPMSCAPSIPSSTMSSAISVPSSPIPSASSIPLKTKMIVSPMSNKKLDHCKSLISFSDEPWVHISTFNPTPPLPEPQDQCYELVKRKCKISTCCGCKLSLIKLTPMCIF